MEGLLNYATEIVAGLVLIFSGIIVKLIQHWTVKVVANIKDKVDKKDLTALDSKLNEIVELMETTTMLNMQNKFIPEEYKTKLKEILDKYSDHEKILEKIEEKLEDKAGL